MIAEMPEMDRYQREAHSIVETVIAANHDGPISNFEWIMRLSKECRERGVGPEVAVNVGSLFTYITEHKDDA